MRRTILLCGAMSFITAFAGATLAMTLAIPHLAGAQTLPPGNGSSGGEEHFAGSWLLSSTAGSHVGADSTLFTFNEDGTLTESTFGGRPEASITTGHGVWARTGDHTYAITSFHFTRLTPGDDNLERIRATLTLNPTSDGLAGPVVTDTFDDNGNIPASVASTTQATRIAVVPMS